MDTAAAASKVFMVSNKAELQKTLKNLTNFDPTGMPYIGVQFSEGKPLFSRTSRSGFVQSEDFTAADIYVYLKGFLEVLPYLPDDDINMSVTESGVMKLSGGKDFDTTLHVHTAPKSQSGLIRHDIEPAVVNFPVDAFSGFDLRYISNPEQKDGKIIVSGAPTIRQGRVLIPTNVGHVLWTVPQVMPTVNFCPQFSFLKAVSGGVKIKELQITSNKYYRAVVDDLIFCNAGHDGSSLQFADANQQGKELCNFTASALLRGLQAASELTGNHLIDLDPNYGIRIQDQHGNPDTWSLDQGVTWPKFKLYDTQASLIVNTLKQGQGDRIILSVVPSDGQPTLRMSRGILDVNFTIS